MQNLLKKVSVKLILIASLTFFWGWQLGKNDVNLQWQNYKPTVSVVNQEPPKNINVDFKLFWDTWDLLSRKYIDKKALDPKKLFYGAISGMVSAVDDPYTVFLPPEQQKSTKEDLNGSFEGVGIELGFNKDKRLVVLAPLDDTPAAKAGVKPQDIILKINDKETTNTTLPEAVRLIRGPKNSQVILTLYREGETDSREVNLIRDTIIVKSVKVSFIDRQDKKIAHLKLSKFGERTREEWNQAVEQILAENPAGVILDVRNNPGGYLEGAVFVLSEFLDGGDAVLQEDSEGQRQTFKVNRSGKLTRILLEVLINKGSASASEIVAGALQDRKRATLIGEKTFGKGTIQEAQDLPGNTGIHITVAKWLTPGGSWVNDTNGLDPDVKIEASKEDQSKDLQLEKALELFD